LKIKVITLYVTPIIINDKAIPTIIDISSLEFINSGTIIKPINMIIVIINKATKIFIKLSFIFSPYEVHIKNIKNITASSKDATKESTCKICIHSGILLLLETPGNKRLNKIITDKIPDTFNILKAILFLILVCPNYKQQQYDS